jgi:hypothetical protein
MRRTLFEAGFNSPTQAYGVQHPGMGNLLTDVTNFFKGTQTPAPAPVTAPAPAGTVLGIPTEYVLIGGGVALTLGIVAAVISSRKSASKPKMAGRRR